MRTEPTLESSVKVIIKGTSMFCDYPPTCALCCLSYKRDKQNTRCLNLWFYMLFYNLKIRRHL